MTRALGRGPRLAAIATAAVSWVATAAPDAYARTASNGSPPLRILGAVAEIVDNRSVIQVYTRLNRPLPRRRDAEGRMRVRATFFLAGVSGASTSPTWLRPHRANCYAGEVDPLRLPPELRKSRVGTRVSFAIKVRGLAEKVRGRALLIHPERSPESRLGC